MNVNINEFVKRREVRKNLGVMTRIKAEQRLTKLKESLSLIGESMPVHGVQTARYYYDEVGPGNIPFKNWSEYHVPFVVLSEKTSFLHQEIDHFRVLILYADREGEK